MKRQPQPQARRGLMVQRAAARNERLLETIEDEHRQLAIGPHHEEQPDKPTGTPDYLSESHD